MTISLTRVWSRPTIAVPFHYYTDLPGAKSNRAADLENTHIYTTSTNISDNGLIFTKKLETDSIENINVLFKVASSIELDAEFINFIKDTGQVLIQHKLDGLEIPFTITTTYTFNNKNNAELIVRALNNDINQPKIVSVGTSDTSISAVHRYENDQDWNTSHWSDFQHNSILVSCGASRQTVWQLL